ncbi:MAG: DUF445 family protein [Spirochaetia bacterium]|jgi:hypothetical protein|nr:DUF445 family protein [Spirochaetia bacterium]
MTQTAWLLFLVPPAVGSVIGLFTNWLAIKMLFRPLEARHIFGLRIPFTPGILPRERERIAESLADTVANDLLTEDAVAERLRSQGFRTALGVAVHDRLVALMQSTPAGIASAFDNSAGKELGETAGQVVRAIAVSPPFSSGLSAAVMAALDEFKDVRISALIDGTLVRGVAERLGTPEGSGQLAQALAGAVFDRLCVAADRGDSLSSFWSTQSIEAAAERVVNMAYPAVARGLSAVLNQPRVKVSMERAGARILRRALDRLSSMQRFFIGLGQYDRAIIENMPATIEDFVESMDSMLIEEHIRQTISNRLKLMVHETAQRPLVSFRVFSSPDHRALGRQNVTAITASIVSAMDADDLQAFLKAATGETTLGDLISAVPGMHDSLASGVATWLSSLLAGGATEGSGASARLVRSFYEAFASEAGPLSLGQLTGLHGARLESLSSVISDILVELSVKESANVLRSLDIRAMVVAKINSLDMIEVERMLLRVIERELRAVTYFGGVLGAAIGLVQSLIFLIR